MIPRSCIKKRAWGGFLALQCDFDAYVYVLVLLVRFTEVNEGRRARISNPLASVLSRFSSLTSCSCCALGRNF